jgi:hypothetical protein
MDLGLPGLSDIGYLARHPLLGSKQQSAYAQQNHGSYRRQCVIRGLKRQLQCRPVKGTPKGPQDVHYVNAADASKEAFLTEHRGGNPQRTGPYAAGTNAGAL